MTKFSRNILTVGTVLGAALFLPHQAAAQSAAGTAANTPAPAQEIAYEFAFRFDPADDGMMDRLREEAMDYCEQVTAHLGSSDYERQCTREVLAAAYEHIEDAREGRTQLAAK